MKKAPVSKTKDIEVLELSDAEEDEQERKPGLHNIRNKTKRTSRIVLSSVVSKGDKSIRH
jgi:hypothetical protein